MGGGERGGGACKPVSQQERTAEWASSVPRRQSSDSATAVEAGVRQGRHHRCCYGGSCGGGSGGCGRSGGGRSSVGGEKKVHTADAGARKSNTSGPPRRRSGSAAHAPAAGRLAAEGAPAAVHAEGERLIHKRRQRRRCEERRDGSGADTARPPTCPPAGRPAPELCHPPAPPAALGPRLHPRFPWHCKGNSRGCSRERQRQRQRQRQADRRGRRVRAEIHSPHPTPAPPWPRCRRQAGEGRCGLQSGNAGARSAAGGRAGGRGGSKARPPWGRDEKRFAAPTYLAVGPVLLPSEGKRECRCILDAASSRCQGGHLVTVHNFDL